jgi:hypothetical protein
VDQGRHDSKKIFILCIMYISFVARTKNHI